MQSLNYNDCLKSKPQENFFIRKLITSAAETETHLDYRQHLLRAHYRMALEIHIF